MAVNCWWCTCQIALRPAGPHECAGCTERVKNEDEEEEERDVQSNKNQDNM